MISPHPFAFDAAFVVKVAGLIARIVVAGLVSETEILPARWRFGFGVCFWAPLPILHLLCHWCMEDDLAQC